MDHEYLHLHREFSKAFGRPPSHYRLVRARFRTLDEYCQALRQSLREGRPMPGVDSGAAAHELALHDTAAKAANTTNAADALDRAA